MITRKKQKVKKLTGKKQPDESVFFSPLPKEKKKNDWEWEREKKNNNMKTF